MAKQGALLRSYEFTAGLVTPALEELRSAANSQPASKSAEVPVWIGPGPRPTPASQLPSKEESSRFVPLELPGLKPLFAKGLKPGTITQIEGSRSSGRTSIGAHFLAQATSRGEVCAVVDVQNNFHPESMQAAGVSLDHLLWVRCNGNPEHAMRAADLLLHAGGFGIVWLDMCEVPPSSVQRIPLSYWYRFRRAIENTATILLVSADLPCAKSSLSNNIQLTSNAIDWLGNPGVVRLVNISATLQKNAETHPFALQAVI